MEKKHSRFFTLLGFVVIAVLFTGATGLLVAGQAYKRGDLIGVGACLTASALAFGFLANALLRK